MIDSFPYDEWSEKITSFWTFGPGNSTGTYVLTAVGFIVMVASLIGFFVLENRKLAAQAALLRAAGGFGVPGEAAPGPGPSQQPLAGPSTDPGT